MESSDLLCSDARNDSSAAVITLQHVEEDNAYYEQRYRQLMREKDEFERKLERERRERESLETSYRRELEERLCWEDKFTDVSGAMAKYERELSLLRSENNHLNTQFSQLRSVVSGRVGSTSAVLHAGEGVSSGSFANHAVTGFVSDGSEGSFPTVNNEMYREEVAILSHENELFKQIIEIIERQEDHLQGEESFLLKNKEMQGSENSEQIMWLKTENSKLEERVREIERNAREQETSTEREREKAEEDIRKLKKEVQSLKSQLEMGTQDLDDYESQITEIKRQWDLDVQDMQVKLETEVSIKCELQEQLQLLEMNVRALEEERKTLLDKIEVAYKKEDEIFSQREVLEDTYSHEISEMERKLDQESHGKMEAFAEVEKLTNELVEVRNQQEQMQEVYVRDLEEIRLRFEAEKEDLVRHVQGNANTVVVSGQHVPSEAPVHAGADSWAIKLEQETRNRQNLEEENKQLLYQINKILSGNDGAFEKSEEGRSGNTASRSRNEKVRELEDELSELHEKCRVLERDARKKKEFENKNKELMEEIEELMSKKEDMVRKQKELMRAAENSTSNVQEVETKNRRLEEQIDNLSRKVRDMEDNYRREKEDVHQVGRSAKSSEVHELRWENETLKRTTAELQRNNERLENKAKDAEQKLRELQGVKDRMENEAISAGNRHSREIDLERSKVELLGRELERTSESLKKQANEFERTQEERKRLYEEHQRKLEDDKQRVKNELESEKEALRRRFEDERRAIEQRVSEIEAKLRQQGFSTQDAFSVTSGTCGAMVQQQDLVNQQLSFHPNQTALRHEVTALKAANEELEGKVRDMERKFQREVEELMYKHDQEKRKLGDEMRENFRTRLEDVKQQYEAQTAESSRRTETNRQNDQQQAFEKSNIAVKFQREKEDIIRAFEGEKRSLTVVIQSLKKDVCALTKERDHALLALNTARRNAENRDATNYENVARVKSECEERIRVEKEKKHRKTTELERKIIITEGKVKDIEAKYRVEMETLERKHKEQRMELENVIQEQVRVRLQAEYTARLKEERERYEETLKGLRREISALQEQRKQIQLKLKTTDVSTSNKSTTKELRFYNKAVYSKFEHEHTARLTEEKRKLDDRVKDLEQEVQMLKREKAEIKSSYRQEKAQMEAEFETGRHRLDERYKKERDELRKRLGTSQVRVMVVSDDKEALAQRKVMQKSNLVLDAQRNDMENEMNSMKNRLEDLESRQRQRAASQQRKREFGQHQRVRFSSPERESALKRTLYTDDSITGRSSLKRYSSAVDLRSDGHNSDSYIGSSSLRSGLVGSSGASFRRQSLSVNLPLSGEMSGGFMNSGGSSLAGFSGDANFRSSSNTGMSGSSLRRHASSFELSSAGQSADSLLGRASSPTKMSSTSLHMFPGRSSQFGSFAKSANFQAGGTRSMGYRPASSGMSFQGNFSRGFNALALSGGMFPRNPALFQEVNYLPSVGILGGSAASSRDWFGGYGAGSGHSNRASRVGLNRAFSSSTGVLNGAGLVNSGAVRCPTTVSDANMAAVSVSAGERTSAENGGTVLVSSEQQICSTSSDASDYQATMSLNAEQQQQMTSKASSCQVVSAVSVSSDQSRVDAGQGEVTAADMTSSSCNDVISDGADVGVPSDDQTG